MIQITDAAKQYLSQMLQKEGAIGFTINVIGGGCSGMQYKFGYIKDPAKLTGEVVEFDEFKVNIEPTAVLYIIGTTLDYEVFETRARLVFKNPNEKHKCGCGKSFSV